MEVALRLVQEQQRPRPEQWLAWTVARLAPTDGDPRDAAIGVLAAIDGLLLVRFVLGADHADRATAWLLGAVGRSDGSV